MDASLKAYYLGNFKPLYESLGEFEADSEEMQVHIGRLKLVQAYGQLDDVELPSVSGETVHPSAEPFFKVARGLRAMKDCKTREDVLELASSINQDADGLTANRETHIDGKILEIQMLRFLPPFVGGSREKALEQCDELSSVDGCEDIAVHFQTLIKAELDELDA